ncbi:hypothetical protein M513_13556 [Trichuris suis]|uniref:Uncharacterized protein n=1 Tax=Trichuris suis TaxID=68888 RepID=A0A085LKS1_9BILA|nr:hypothetical protein M513_13556 [Trichuris suis]
MTVNSFRFSPATVFSESLESPSVRLSLGRCADSGRSKMSFRGWFKDVPSFCLDNTKKCCCTTILGTQTAGLNSVVPYDQLGFP